MITRREFLKTSAAGMALGLAGRVGVGVGPRELSDMAWKIAIYAA